MSNGRQSSADVSYRADGLIEKLSFECVACGSIVYICNTESPLTWEQEIIKSGHAMIINDFTYVVCDDTCRVLARLGREL